MADIFRYRYGSIEPPVVVAVNADVAIEIGDLVGQETDDLRPASSWAFTSLAQTQEDFVDDFVGVSSSRVATAGVGPARVATTGVFEFICAAAQFELGALVGPAENSGALANQTVVLVTDASRAIGRVARQYTEVNTETVLVQITSSVMHGGVQQAQASA